MGERAALRKVFAFTEDRRDILLSSDSDSVISATRRRLKKYGQPMLVDAEKKFKNGGLSEREYKILAAGAKSADKDAGVA